MMRDEHGGRHRRWAPTVAAIAILAMAGSAAGCGDDTAGGEKGPDVQSVTSEYFGSNKYVGKNVTISAAVSEIFSTQAFQVAGDDFGDESLRVLSAEPRPGVGVGDTISAAGTVRPFDFDRYAQQYGMSDDRNRYQTYGEEMVLVGATVTTPDEG